MIDFTSDSVVNYKCHFTSDVDGDCDEDFSIDCLWHCWWWKNFPDHGKINFIMFFWFFFLERFCWWYLLIVLYWLVMMLNTSKWPNPSGSLGRASTFRLRGSGFDPQLGHTKDLLKLAVAWHSALQKKIAIRRDGKCPDRTANGHLFLI